MAPKPKLSRRMEEALLTIGDAYWLRGIRWDTKNALIARGLIVREASHDGHIIGLTDAGLQAYFDTERYQIR